MVKNPSFSAIFKFQKKTVNFVSALAAFVESFAIIKMDSDIAIDFNIAMQDDEIGEAYRRKILQSSEYWETVKHYLPFLRKRGMLDI